MNDKKIQPQPEPTSPLRILCGRFSPCDNFLALCDDHKQMTLWSKEQGQKSEVKFVLKKQWNLERRANKVIFGRTSDEILIAGNFTWNILIHRAFSIENVVVISIYDVYVRLPIKKKASLANSLTQVSLLNVLKHCISIQMFESVNTFFDKINWAYYHLVLYSFSWEVKV